MTDMFAGFAPPPSVEAQIMPDVDMATWETPVTTPPPPTPSMRLQRVSLPDFEAMSLGELIGAVSTAFAAGTLVSFIPFTGLLFSPSLIGGIGGLTFLFGRFRRNQSIETLAMVVMVGMLLASAINARTATAEPSPAPVQFERPMVEAQ